ncbi:MAG TPA: 2-amino-4-hydroxy-6-hydroxymethyldihydropteridine diphosphokinase [Xanthomonadaceae bacterium]|nr:2-amino-4-hydroxy-6-hydroxymethyldihydropteridine diphosphokinase [Xanthomonadaceae bacterium]
MRAWVGLGGNVGDAAATLRAALPALDALPATRLLRASRLYRTPAWGLTDQPDFVNAVAELETALSPRDLLDGLLAVERAFGRERRERWGPRTLDLDLLLHGDVALDEPGLHLPHPHLHERAFVLLPLAELAPGMPIPGHGRVADFLTAVDAAGCVPLSG